VSGRVSAIKQVQVEIDRLFASGRELGEVLEDVARLGVRLVMQAAMEAEDTTTVGAIELFRPNLRNTDEAFASRLRGLGVSRTDARRGPPSSGSAPAVVQPSGNQGGGDKRSVECVVEPTPRCLLHRSWDTTHPR